MVPSTASCSTMNGIAQGTYSGIRWSYSGYMPQWNLCYRYNGGPSTVVQVIDMVYPSYSLSSAAAPSSGRAFVGYPLTVTLHGFTGKSAADNLLGEYKVQLSRTSSCSSVISIRSFPSGSSVTFTGLTTPAAAVYVCLDDRAKDYGLGPAIAMPKYTAGLSSLTPTPFVLEQLKTVSFASISGLAVGVGVSVDITVSGLPQGSETVTYGFTFENPADNSKATFSPATVTFTASSPTTQTITITGTSMMVAQPLKLVKTGDDAGDFAAPTQTQSVAIKTVVSYNFPTQFIRNVPVTVTASLVDALPGDVTVTVSSSSASLDPATLNFAAGETSKTFEVILSSVGTATVTTAISGTSASLVQPHADVTLNCVDTALVFVDHPRRLYISPHGGRLISVRVTEYPLSVSVSGSASATLYTVGLTCSTSGAITFDSGSVSWTASGPSLSQTINATGVTVGH
eukprot:PhM_4_TR14654/c2_g1_i1/m.90928